MSKEFPHGLFILLDLDPEKPDFLNQEGFKWWREKSMQSYADSKKLDVECWIVMDKDFNLTRALTYEGEIIYTSTSMENIACKIDEMHIAKKFGII